MTKNPAEIAGTRYKNEKLMSRMQKTDGTSRCFAQNENIKRQSLVKFVSLNRRVLHIIIDLDTFVDFIFYERSNE